MTFRRSKHAPLHLGILAEIKTLFGAAPVLTSENIEAYDMMLLGLIACHHPADFYERMLVRQLADWEWETFRFTRHHTWNIERKYQQMQAHGVKAAAPRQQAQAQKPAEENKDDATADPARAAQRKVDATLQQSPTERDHAEARERGIGYAECLDKLRNAAVARRNATLDEFVRYRAIKRKAGFQPLVIDHECQRPNEVAPPPDLSWLNPAECESPANSEVKKEEDPSASSGTE
jgi:hypothetical protein